MSKLHNMISLPALKWAQFFFNLSISVTKFYAVVFGKPYLFGYKMSFSLSRITPKTWIILMKLCIYMRLSLPKQPKRSKSILGDGSRFLRLFWRGKTHLITKEILYEMFLQIGILSFLQDLHMILYYMFKSSLPYCA